MDEEAEEISELSDEQLEARFGKGRSAWVRKHADVPPPQRIRFGVDYYISIPDRLADDDDG